MFESSRQVTSVIAAGVAAEVEGLAGRFRFPDEQAAAAVGRGQQHAVGAELDGVDPVGVLPDLVQQLAVGGRVDADDAARAAEGDQRVLWR